MSWVPSTWRKGSYSLDPSTQDLNPEGHAVGDMPEAHLMNQNTEEDMLQTMYSQPTYFERAGSMPHVNCPQDVCAGDDDISGSREGFVYPQLDSFFKPIDDDTISRDVETYACSQMHIFSQPIDDVSENKAIDSQEMFPYSQTNSFHKPNNDENVSGYTEVLDPQERFPYIQTNSFHDLSRSDSPERFTHVNSFNEATNDKYMARYAEVMDSSERFEYTESESFHEAIDQEDTLGYTPGIYSPERFEHTSNNFHEPSNE